jgi:hypothetical protein
VHTTKITIPLFFDFVILKKTNYLVIFVKNKSRFFSFHLSTKNLITKLDSRSFEIKTKFPQITKNYIYTTFFANKILRG